MNAKIVFLGQAGLYVETDGLKIIIDPYLSNSVEKINPEKHRRQPIEETWFKVKPNVLLFTHDHLDHYDEDTVKNYLSKDTEITILSPRSVWEKVRLFGGKNNFVLFDAGTIWTEKGVQFQAVKAEHSDRNAIGIILMIGKERYYITGDTLYSERVLQSLPKRKITAVFLPINGEGNNMNATDAARFAKRLKAKWVVPVHFGLFDALTGNELDLKNVKIPHIYQEIRFEDAKEFT